MNALEIMDRLKDGEAVEIRAVDATEFMRQCEFHGLTSPIIEITIDWPKCTLRIVQQFDEVGENK